MANSKKRAFGYIRVSTSMQVESGYSLDDQENKIREKAKIEGYELVEIFRDEGKSGKNISGRPQFRRMFKCIEEGERVDFVIVTRMSRFGRNATDVMIYLKKLKSYGVNLRCLDVELDSSKPMGEGMIMMSSVFAQVERDNIREQTRAGRYEKARQGKRNGGQAPYGYRIGRDKYGAFTGVLVVDEDESKVVRDVFEWYANENVGIAGIVGIATRLNTNKVRKVPRGNGTQSFFTPNSVRKILENPVYNGKIAYGRRKMTLTSCSRTSGARSNSSR